MGRRHTPLGFQFTSFGQLVVSEAFGGTAGAGAVSSYRLGDAPGYSKSASGADHRTYRRSPDRSVLDRRDPEQSLRIYVEHRERQHIAELDVAADGSLVDTGRSVTVPDTTVGLVAR